MKSKYMIGRLFSIKNYNRIICDFDKIEDIKKYKNYKITLSKQQVGNIALILDEKTKKIKFITANNLTVWMSKYYLAYELEQKHEMTVSAEIQNLIELLAKINSNISKHENIYLQYQNNFNEILMKARSIQTKIDNIC